MEFYGPVSNLLVQVKPATAFFPVVAHWLVFPTPLLMLSTKHNGSRLHFFKVFGMTRPAVEPRTFQLQCGCSNHENTQPVSFCIVYIFVTHKAMAKVPSHSEGNYIYRKKNFTFKAKCIAGCCMMRVLCTCVPFKYF